MCHLSDNYFEKQVISHPELMGKCCSFSANSVTKFETLISDSLKEALLVRQQCRCESSRREVIKNIRDRGVSITNRLSGYDKNEVIGLIGEIVMANFVECSGSKMIYVKWREAGTSKSKGIDLIAMDADTDLSEIKLCEAKHIHSEQDMTSNYISLLKGRFRAGLDEFESEKTQLNLSSVIMKLGKAIHVGEAAMTDQTAAKGYYTLITSSLKENRYRIRIVVLIDQKYCNTAALMDSTAQITRPLKVGKEHKIDLSLLELEALEEITKEMCEAYDGAV